MNGCVVVCVSGTETELTGRAGLIVTRPPESPVV